MMNELTNNWFKKHNVCEDFYLWVLKRTDITIVGTVNQLISEDRYDWANWTIARCFLCKKHKLQYAIFAAESVLDIFEKRYSKDNRPRLAIEAAKKVLKRDTKNNRNAAYAAYADVKATDVTDNVVTAYVGTAAYAAKAAATAAALAAYDSVWCAYAAAHAAAEAVWYAEPKKNIQAKIINYGLSLLKGGNLDVRG